MYIPVTKDKFNNTDIVLLDINEVIYIEMEDRNVVYHTLHDKYYHLAPSLSVIGIHLESHGFRKLDRINLVNTNQVRAFDDEHGKVFFETDVQPASKYATIPFLHKKKLRQEIEVWISNNNGNNIK
ncbi:LytTR family transcriptional regulator DNA-binding domain-containing protein [Paenibacillus sp. y28]|uniref:LytTR family transcriptional regulator DNA-binding domain-containing protein n=1 Tax=Paenibacillus sp. y28 TaxID=3129110 RepID=UPI003015A634